MTSSPTTADVSIIGAGPAGLMAAERIALAGFSVAIFEQKPTVGRKFLRAGIGGLNLSHSEDPALFLSRYSQPANVQAWLEKFNSSALRLWAKNLGIETFVGSSGRIFPVEKKAAPLLRAWVKRLKKHNVKIYTHHQWLGWDNKNQLLIQDTQHHNNENKTFPLQSKAYLFCLGGGSWHKLGSDGLWLEKFKNADIDCNDFEASNGGFEYSWSKKLCNNYAGTPLKNISLSVLAPTAGSQNKDIITFPKRKGEALISDYGIEGSLIYAASAAIRTAIKTQGRADIAWDLLPDKTPTQIHAALSTKQGKQSLSNFLRKKLGLQGSKLSLLYELGNDINNLQTLPDQIKNLPQTITQSRPINEAISTAGGVSFTALNKNLMLKNHTGLFCAGEMIDWDAPTGGYLLNACFASGLIAGEGIIQYLNNRPTP